MLYFCFLLVPYWEFYFTKFFCLLWKKHLWQLFCHLCGCGAFFERFPDPHKSVSDHIWPAVFVAIADSVLVKELWTLVRVIHHRIHQEIYSFLFTMLDTTSTPSRSRTLFGSSVTKILTDVIRVWSTGWHLTQYGSFSSEEKPSQHPLLCIMHNSEGRTCVQDIHNFVPWLSILCCFFNSKHNGLFLTDGWILGTDESHVNKRFFQHDGDWSWNQA